MESLAARHEVELEPEGSAIRERWACRLADPQAVCQCSWHTSPPQIDTYPIIVNMDRHLQ